MHPNEVDDTSGVSPTRAEGSVSDRFYCLPTQFSHRQTQKRDTPQLLEWLREDEIDVVVMVPL